MKSTSKEHTNSSDLSLTNTPLSPPISPDTQILKPTEHASELTSNQDIPTSIEPSRQKHTPSYLVDYVCNDSYDSAESKFSGTPYPITNFLFFSHLSRAQHALSYSLTHSTEPKSYKEVSIYKHWLTTIKSELEALKKLGTWTIIDIPPQVKSIGNRWIFKVKHRDDGTIERYNA